MYVPSLSRQLERMMNMERSRAGFSVVETVKGGFLSLIAKKEKKNIDRLVIEVLVSNKVTIISWQHCVHLDYRSEENSTERETRCACLSSTFRRVQYDMGLRGWRDFDRQKRCWKPLCSISIKSAISGATYAAREASRSSMGGQCVHTFHCLEKNSVIGTLVLAKALGYAWRVYSTHQIAKTVSTQPRIRAPTEFLV